MRRVGNVDVGNEGDVVHGSIEDIANSHLALGKIDLEKLIPLKFRNTW
jgi:hypothetical protein